MTALAEELLAKFEHLDEHRLYIRGCDAFRGGDIHFAAGVLADYAQSNPKAVYALAKHYIETRIAPDMRGDALSSVRGGQIANAPGQIAAAAPHGPVEGEKGQHLPATAAAGVPSSPSPSENVEAKAGKPKGQPTPTPTFSPSDAGGAEKHKQSRHPAAAPPASPIRDGAGQGTRALGQLPTARPVTKPNPPRGIDAIATAQRDEHRALFDTFKVRGRIPIGDLTVFEAKQIATTNEREARILRERTEKIGWSEPGAKLRDLIRPADLAKAVQQNREPADV